MMIQTTSHLWGIPQKPKSGTRLRLFCFPYAGGGAAVFRGWAELLPSAVEVIPIQLPGRENRLREPAITQIPLLVQTVAQQLAVYLDKPFVLWGHSMGALISFELARQFRRENKPAPIHLFLSGHKAPQVEETKPPIHGLPEAEFIEEIRLLNGTPEAVFQNKELMQLLIPILRADFTAVESYQYTHEAPLDCSMSVYGGLQDDTINQRDLMLWSKHTTQTFRLHMFPGDHFFLHDAQAALLQTVSHKLWQLLNQ